MGVKVLLNSVDKVKDFIDITRSVSYDIDLISGRDTYLDAKSLLGVLSCDCTKPLTLDIHAEMEERKELMERLEEYGSGVLINKRIHSGTRSSRN